MNNSTGILLVDDRDEDRALSEVVLRDGFAGARLLVPENPLALGGLLATEDCIAAALIEADLGWCPAAELVDKLRSRFPRCLVIFYSAGGIQTLTPELAGLGLSGFYKKCAGDLLRIRDDLIGLLQFETDTAPPEPQLTDLAPEEAQPSTEALPVITRAEEDGRESEEHFLSEMFYTISHDLRQPLQILRRQIKLLDERYKNAMDTPGQGLVENMVQVAQQMELLLESILSYHRMDGSQESDDLVDISEVFNNVLDVLKIPIDDVSAKIVVTELPPLPVARGPATQLFQNLLDNAIKFRGKAPLQVEISALEVADSWLFTVQDNGVGFDDTASEQIFALFKRLDDSGEVPGSGVGLALCKKIVEQAGGKIWARSQPGKGTSIHFTLPKASAKSGSADRP